MRRKVTVLVAVVSLMLLCSCSSTSGGTATDEEKERADSLQVKYEQLQSDYDSLNEELIKLKADYEQSQSEYNSLKENTDKQLSDYYLIKSDRDEQQTLNKDLSARLKEAENTIENLRYDVKMANSSLFSYSYSASELLSMISGEGGKVSIFPARLKSVAVDTDESGYRIFVFELDKLEINKAWDGPGTTEDGFFSNSEEKFERFSGGLNIIFENYIYHGVDDYQMKIDSIIKDYNPAPGDSELPIYNFYTVGDEIVMVGVNPGP